MASIFEHRFVYCLYFAVVPIHLTHGLLWGEPILILTNHAIFLMTFRRKKWWEWMGLFDACMWSATSWQTQGSFLRFILLNCSPKTLRKLKNIFNRSEISLKNQNSDNLWSHLYCNDFFSIGSNWPSKTPSALMRWIYYFQLTKDKRFSCSNVHKIKMILRDSIGRRRAGLFCCTLFKLKLWDGKNADTLTTFNYVARSVPISRVEY